MISDFPRYKLLILTVLVEGVALIAAIIIAGYYDIKLLPLSQNLVHDILIGALGALIPLLLFYLLLSGRVNNIPLLGPLRRTVIDDIRAVFSETKLLDLCFISACAGLAEELLFRGAVQAKFGIVVASVIFGLLHFITPAYCIIATIMGFYLGFLFRYYDSILIPIQLHFVYDLGALIYLRYFVVTDGK